MELDLRAETRAYGRARLREAALDAVRQVVLDRGWSAVRMGALATAIGVSRASLYLEFGTKDALGNALVMRETSVFFAEMAERLAQHHGDLGGAVHAAVTYMLDATGDNPLLQTILTRAPVGGDTSLLPSLTTHVDPLIAQAVDILSDWTTEQWPELPPADVHLMADGVVRTGLSHILTGSSPKDAVARELTLMACRCLKFPDPENAKS